MMGAMQGVAGSYRNYISYQYTSKTTSKTSVYGVADNMETRSPETKSQRGTVMAEYYAKNPQYKTTQENRVNGGYSVLSSMGVFAEDIESMSMEEFKGVMTEAIGKIPFDATRLYDEEAINISEEGWENMKKDPDYAAWALGYIKENRAVRNPFLGMGDKGMYDIYNFGASPGDYHGQAFSKIYGGTAAGARAKFNEGITGDSMLFKGPQADAQPPADYDLWEERRRVRKQRTKELIEAEIQSRIQYTKRINAMYEQKYFDHQQLLRSMDPQDVLNIGTGSYDSPVSPSAAAASYEASLVMGMDGML